MKNFIAFLFFLSVCLTSWSENLPATGISTVSEYPVFYVNTVDGTPIDQKEVYIEATAWLDVQGLEGVDAVGTEEKPVELGIRGRGNSSWLLDGPKPYKMKFEKKQSFFGRTKNKHWVLLPISNYTEYYNNMVGLEMGRQLGLSFLPSRHIVQVVLNGQFIGIYMLGENIRIDEGRVDIYEQPEENEDDATIPYGWLVEVDNYYDKSQVRIPLLNTEGKNITFMRITHHSPEVVSVKQQEWLYNNFNDLIFAANNENKLDRTWESFIDIDDLAKYFVIQETLHNFDAYRGSWYLHKDLGDEVWHIGSLWDMGWSLGAATVLMAEYKEYVLSFMDDIVKFPRFLAKANEILSKYKEENPVEWIDTFCDELSVQMDKAFEVQRLVWPDLANRLPNHTSSAKKYFKENIAYLENRLNSDLLTHKVTLEIVRDNDGPLDAGDVDPTLDAVVLIDGMNFDAVDVVEGQEITLSFESCAGREVTSVLINDDDRTGQLSDGCLVVENVTEDLNITVTFGPVAFIPVTGIEIDPETAELMPGETLLLHPTVHPGSATDYTVVWESADESIATVDAEGLVTAMSAGQTTVTAKTDNGLSASCRITVSEVGDDYGDDNAAVTERSYITPYKTYDFTRFVDSGEIAYWISSNQELISVSADGVVYAETFGESVLRAKDRFGRTVALFDIFSCPTLYLEHGNGTIYAHPVVYNSRPAVYIGAPETYEIAGITHDGQAVPDDLIDEDGYYTCAEPIVKDSAINISLKYDDTSSTGSIPADRDIRLYVNGHTLTVTGADPTAKVNIHDAAGITLFNEANDTFRFENPGIYFVNIQGVTGSYKIIVR